LPEDPALYLRALSELNLFETAAVSDLDAKRGELYRDQARRDEERGRFLDVQDYLRSLETTVRCDPFLPRHLARIAQLVQRSNQFNLTTRRYSEAECGALMEDGAHYIPFTVTVRDRFGDYGLVSVVVLRRTPLVLEIETFLMSCRVLQRGVEHFAMSKVFEHARKLGIERVVGRYLPTAKNSMVKGLLPSMGFHPVHGPEGEGEAWYLPVSEYTPPRLFLRDEAEAETTGGEVNT
jgi:FkbH-like protein